VPYMSDDIGQVLIGELRTEAESLQNGAHDDPDVLRRVVSKTALVLCAIAARPHSPTHTQCQAFQANLVRMFEKKFLAVPMQAGDSEVAKDDDKVSGWFKSPWLGSFGLKHINGRYMVVVVALVCATVLGAKWLNTQTHTSELHAKLDALAYDVGRITRVGEAVLGAKPHD